MLTQNLGVYFSARKRCMGFSTFHLFCTVFVHSIGFYSCTGMVYLAALNWLPSHASDILKFIVCKDVLEKKVF